MTTRAKRGDNEASAQRGGQEDAADAVLLMIRALDLASRIADRHGLDDSEVTRLLSLTLQRARHQRQRARARRRQVQERDCRLQ
jgi:hypothetical protein